jgi:cellulose biosynthesis protein BcsQ
MGSGGTEIDDQSTVESTPEDVASLYAWANLHGVSYRDYSASRREHRAQVRYRAARAMLERELKAQLEAEAAAAEAERLAAAGEGGVDPQPGNEAARKAAADRVEAARRAESAARAAVIAMREQKEIAEAHSSALRQAQVYEEARLQLRPRADPQLFGPAISVPEAGAPGTETIASRALEGIETVEAQASRHPLLFSSWPEMKIAEEDLGELRPMSQPADALAAEPDRMPAPALESYPVDPTAPAWLFPSAASRDQEPPAATAAPRADTLAADTLQDSRERMASRWFALKGIFNQAVPEAPGMQPARPSTAETPLLAVFSLAGGVGKTTLVATLARALAAQSEKVAIADTTARGLIPIYFGDQDIQALSTRLYLPKWGSGDTPIALFSHELPPGIEGQGQREVFSGQILQNAKGYHRLLLDFNSGETGLLSRLADLHPTVLVPMVPEMSSVLSLRAVENIFRSIVDSEGRALQPLYVLNQFDASRALHLDVREVLRRQLGNRLVRLAIRSSSAVSEALADGMTVLEYAPDADVAQDYRELATWLRALSPPAGHEAGPLLWGSR